MDTGERQIRAKIGATAQAGRAILDKAEAEKRGLTAEEETNYQRIDGELDIQSRQLAIYKKEHTQPEGALADFRAMLLDDQLRKAPNRFGLGEQRDLRYEPEGRRDAFRRYLRDGVAGIDAAEYRALQADNDTAGGYLVLPLSMVGAIVKKTDDEVFIRKLATIYPVPAAESLGAPALDNDPADPDWTGEITPVSEDVIMDFGKRELTPHPLSRLIKVSSRLLRASFLDAEAIVVDRLTYKFATVQENSFLNGNSSNQPMGVFTAAAAGFGISTARDVSTGNTTTAFTTDGLIEAFYSLKAQYRKKAQWIFHRDAVKKIRKLKDGEGNYVWQLGFSQNKPDTILGCPYNESEYAPATFTAGQYVGIIGDFSHYWIAESMSMKIQRLIELYAATNQVGFIGRQELDGQPVNEEAFARVTLAT